MVEVCNSLLPQGMAEIENMYASSVTKLLNSVAYTFHSNVFMKWLGSEPFGELGYVLYNDDLMTVQAHVISSNCFTTTV